MAIKYYEKYPQRWESPSQDYPQGAFKNLSALGEQDGSYLEKDWLNDYSGFFGALLRNAEMTPDGTIDTAQKSQFYDALIKVAKESVDLSAYRKKDDLLFKSMLKVQATDDVSAGVFLQDTGGTVRGQVVATEQGLQLTQYPKDGGLQTFTFPSEGGELALVKESLSYSDLNDTLILNAINAHSITLTRNGLSRSNIVQSYAIDNIKRLQYTQHVTKTGSVDGSEISVINVFDLNTNTHIKTNKGSYDLGHQGLTVQNVSKDKSYLWSSRRFSVNAQDRFEDYLVRFSDDFTNNGELNDIQFFKVFPSDVSRGGAQATVSKDGSQLVVWASIVGQQRYVVRVFDINIFTSGGDYSDKHLHEFYVDAVKVNGGKSIQSAIADNNRLLTISTGASRNDLGYIYCWDFKGNLISKTLFTVGMEDSTSHGSVYEPEGSAWFYDAVLGVWIPRVQIAFGEAGASTVNIFDMGTAYNNNVQKLKSLLGKGDILTNDYCGIGSLSSPNLTDIALGDFYKMPSGSYRPYLNVGNSINPIVLLLHGSNVEMTSMLAFDPIRKRMSLSMKHLNETEFTEGEVWTTLNTEVMEDGTIKKLG